MIDLKSYIIPAMESDIGAESILSIIKKYPIKYPKEFDNYQFTTDGRFDGSTKSVIKEFFNSSNWEKRFNNILSETLSLPSYAQKIKSYCEKTGYSINDFRVEVYNIYFNEYKGEAKYTQMYINISFYKMDRYDAPGFPQMMQPILSQIVKNDIGSHWVVVKDEYPTDFSIYRPLSSNEAKVLQEIQNASNEKKRLAKEKAVASKQIRNQKNKERISQEIANDQERFYNQSLKDQAMEIVKYFTFNRKYYYDNYGLKKANDNLNSLKSIKPKPGEKIFSFNYSYSNSYDLWGKPVQIKRVCYALTTEKSEYKKLEKVFFLDWEDTTSKTYESYMTKKVLSKK